MTAARDDSLAPVKFLSDRGINVVKVTGKELPKEHELSYDKQEALIYLVILFASAAPAFLLWRLS
jgi:hypothetical protein